MTTGHVFIGTSLDGFIARSNNDIAWLTDYPTPGEDHGFTAHMDRVDGVVMGRGTYDAVKTMRPWLYDKPVVVLSRSLTQNQIAPDIASKVEVINATPQEAMGLFAKRGWQRVYVDGGTVIQSFLKAGLIDDLVISRLPVLIGEGISLFGPLAEDVQLDHFETKTFPSGLVQSTYRVKR
ncbi:dihydrofolate reductase family protein [Devosia chinhatensis]|uniref:Deaminase/reductase n=1 Tax=Devosia chinhatensis TaxID=429727 RepID=A0A0F5FIU6_9HYPH|nr:dihydrofolate reductase family protein [Devosia chinhatensis]KKB08713.1 deaminase/reductase [Devosia chinhatensis]